MNNSHPPIQAFLTAGFLSGICSGVTMLTGPLALLLPGVIFGLFVSQAVHVSLRTLSPVRRGGLVSASTFAYVVAVIVCIVSCRLPGFDNGYFGGGRSGAIAGGVGAFIFAVAIIFIIGDFNSLTFLGTITFTGTLLGSLFFILAIYISDETALGHPFDDFVAFSIWQTGVAATIPLFHRRTERLSESDVPGQMAPGTTFETMP